VIALSRAALDIGAVETSAAGDVERLTLFQDQIQNRMEHLAGLSEGEESSVPVEEQIQSPILGLLGIPQKWRLVISQSAKQAPPSVDLSPPCAPMPPSGPSFGWPVEDACPQEPSERSEQVGSPQVGLDDLACGSSGWDRTQAVVGSSSSTDPKAGGGNDAPVLLEVAFRFFRPFVELGMDISSTALLAFVPGQGCKL